MGRDLFARLLEKTACGEWDDEYLLLLIEYQKLYPASEKFEVFYARYALAHGNVPLALETAHAGELKRRVSPVLWALWRSVTSGWERCMRRHFTAPICACIAIIPCG